MDNVLEFKYKQHKCPFCAHPIPREKLFNPLITCEFCDNSFTDDNFELLDKGIGQLVTEMYDEARITFSKLSEKLPKYWKAWVGLYLAKTKIRYGSGESEKDKVYKTVTRINDYALKNKLKDLSIKSPERIQEITNNIKHIDVMISNEEDKIIDADARNNQARIVCWGLSGGSLLSFLMLVIGLASASFMWVLGILIFTACTITLLKNYVFCEDAFIDVDHMRQQRNKLLLERSRLDSERKRLSNSPDIEYYIQILEED